MPFSHKLFISDFAHDGLLIGDCNYASSFDVDVVAYRAASANRRITGRRTPTRDFVRRLLSDCACVVLI